MTTPTITMHTLLTEPHTTEIIDKMRPICLVLALGIYSGALSRGLNPVEIVVDDGAGNRWTWRVRGGMRGLSGQWMGVAGV